MEPNAYLSSAADQPGAQETLGGLLGGLEAAPPNTEARALAPRAVPLDDGAASPAASAPVEVAVEAAEVDPQAVSPRPLEPS